LCIGEAIAFTAAVRATAGFIGYLWVCRSKGMLWSLIEEGNEDETGIEFGISKMHVGDFVAKL